MNDPSDEDGDYVWLPVPPRVKQRPRLGRKGRVFTPQQTVDYEQRLADEWAVATKKGPAGGPLIVEIVYCKDGQWVRVRTDPASEREHPKGRGDLDNYIKATLDGLNGAAWMDDKQVQIVKANFAEKPRSGKGS